MTMHRRAFIASCASGVVGATLAHAQTRSSNLGANVKAISALIAAKQLEASGDFQQLRKAFHSDALLVESGTLAPSVGRAAIIDTLRKNAQERRPLYFYYRQPQTLVVGNCALVISNYESGYDIGGQTVEDSGKSSSVVLLGPNPPLIALEVLVPNLYAGSYGALGTALSAPHFGLFPLRALGPAAATEAKSAGGGENDVLYSQVQRINKAWVSGSATDLLKYADKSGVFLIGDYSPFYITGTDEVKQHFADFYKTSKVNFVRSLDPTVRIWGSAAAVYFNFDLDYTVNGKTRRSPGRGVYTFTRRGAPGMQWAMAACAASHLVLRNIGDPYPMPGN